MKRLVTTLVVATLTIPTVEAAEISRARYLMGTVCEIATRDTPQAEVQIDRALEEIDRIEARVSTWRSESELSRLNRGEIQRPSPELYALLARAMQLREETNGAFTPLVAPLLEIWKTRGAGAAPSREAIRRALARVQPSNVSIANGDITLSGGAEFEEGAFGKGYALDRAAALLPPDAVVNFGGQVLARARKIVAIADPRNRGAAIAELTIDAESISTSSGSEKSFLVGGREFSHILDPRTGEALPSRGSVTVISPSALTADVLSTALYVMGPDEGLRWADAHGVAAIFVTSDRSLLVSRPLRADARGLRILDAHFKLKD